MPHCVNKCIDKPVDKRCAHIQIPAITRCTPEYTAEDISPALVWRNSSICNCKCKRADMIGNYIHRRFESAWILFTCNLNKIINYRKKNICEVVWGFVLQHANHTFKSHTSINMPLGQVMQLTLFIPVVLDKYQVPYLHHIGVIRINIFRSAAAFGKVKMYLGAGTAWTGITHFPKIIFFVKLQNMAVIDIGFWFPKFLCFIIFAENSYPQALFIELPYAGQKLPCPLNGFFLVIVTKRPIAEHFEECMMIAVMPNFFEIVMFAAYTNAFLCISTAFVIAAACSKENILELVHSRVGEKQCGVIIWENRCRRHNFVLFWGKEVEEILTYFCRFFQFI